MNDHLNRVNNVIFRPQNRFMKMKSRLQIRSRLQGISVQETYQKNAIEVFVLHASDVR